MAAAWGGLGQEWAEGNYSHEHWNPLYSPPHIPSGLAAPGAMEASRLHPDPQHQAQRSQSQAVLLQLLPQPPPSPVLIPELHFRWTHSAAACGSLGSAQVSGGRFRLRAMGDASLPPDSCRQAGAACDTLCWRSSGGSTGSWRRHAR